MEPPTSPDRQHVSLVIPAYNEAESLPQLLPRLLAHGYGQIIVGDNGSTDATADIARAHGCLVVHEPRKGYGAACAAALTALDERCTVVGFIDADLADDPEALPRLIRVLEETPADLVIGCRDTAERGALTPPQRFGNWLATTLIRLRWGYRYRDLGPLRVIRRAALDAIDMRDRAFGWTVEMQIRALQLNQRIEQVSVPYRCRIGVSKISGTVRGVVLAGYYILTTIARHALRSRV